MSIQPFNELDCVKSYIDLPAPNVAFYEKKLADNGLTPLNIRCLRDAFSQILKKENIMSKRGKRPKKPVFKIAKVINPFAKRKMIMPAPERKMIMSAPAKKKTLLSRFKAYLEKQKKT